MASGTLKQPMIVVDASGVTPETQPNSGGTLTIPITVPTGYNAVFAMCEQTDAYNLFPIWLRDFSNTQVRVMYQNDRTTAQAVSVNVRAICI